MSGRLSGRPMPLSVQQKHPARSLAEPGPKFSCSATQPFEHSQHASQPFSLFNTRRCTRDSKHFSHRRQQSHSNTNQQNRTRSHTDRCPERIVYFVPSGAGRALRVCLRRSLPLVTYDVARNPAPDLVGCIFLRFSGGISSSTSVVA